MKAYLIDHWFGKPGFPDALLVSGELVPNGSGYLFKRDSDGLNLSVNAPDGHITWTSNRGPWETADLTDKGLVYSASWDGGEIHCLVQIVK